ncbi:hypothetical protein CTI14_69685, partial [Methylobacterium radiotolerans]
VVWLRGVVGPLVFAAVAAVVNELSRQQRLRVQQAEELVTERTKVVWLRGVVGPLVFAAVAAVVNELSRQQRLRVQ